MISCITQTTYSQIMNWRLTQSICQIQWNHCRECRKQSGKVNVTAEDFVYHAEHTVEVLEDVQGKNGVLTYKTKRR